MGVFEVTCHSSSSFLPSTVLAIGHYSTYARRKEVMNNRLVTVEPTTFAVF